jgi:transcriptional regulator with GAF, ATPase, and Fis domain
VQARVGRFELADRGTLFLDEVGEIPLLSQGKLLRVLQERQFERVGESRTRSVDVRIVAATNRDLLELSHEGRFREDLYYRLSVFPIHIPPLRERPEDIGPIAEHALTRACARHGRARLSLSERDRRQLERYPWPGNVRELQNAIDRAVIVGRGERLDLSGLAPIPEQRRAVAPCDPCDDLSLADLEQLERRILERALRRSGGKVYGEDGAAAALGLKPTTLASKLKRHGIRRS